MSQESKEHMDEAQKSLRRAKENLGYAAEHAEVGGDKRLAERVRKLAESAGVESEQIKKKLAG